MAAPATRNLTVGYLITMNLEVTVCSDEERLELYRLLAGDLAIRVVL